MLLVTQIRIKQFQWFKSTIICTNFINISLSGKMSKTSNRFFKSTAQVPFWADETFDSSIAASKQCYALYLSKSKLI